MLKVHERTLTCTLIDRFAHTNIDTSHMCGCAKTIELTHIRMCGFHVAKKVQIHRDALWHKITTTILNHSKKKKKKMEYGKTVEERKTFNLCSVQTEEHIANIERTEYEGNFSKILYHRNRKKNN